jgi:hypothetical protein
MDASALPRRLVGAALAGLAAACTSSTSTLTPPAPGPVATITVTPGNDTLTGVNAVSAPFSAVAKDANGNTLSNVTFTWSSASDSVATESAAGVATAQDLGTTTIRATSGGVTGGATLTVVAHYYVDATTGSDANAGTSAAPFKTITKALTVAAAGNTIKVRPGRYDVAHGESFPLAGPAGVILLGDEATQGGGATPTIVVASMGGIGTDLFHPPANAVIAGFTITDSSNLGFGVLLQSAGVTLRNNRIINSTDVGVSTAASTGVITSNLIANNAIGVLIEGPGNGGTGVRVERNTITGNGLGVAYNTGGGDLGGGTAGSAAGNILSCNSNNDVEVASGVTGTAAHNQWDHVPPTVTTTYGGGVDIYIPGSGTLTTTGATLAPNPCK